LIAIECGSALATVNDATASRAARVATLIGVSQSEHATLWHYGACRKTWPSRRACWRGPSFIVAELGADAEPFSRQPKKLSLSEALGPALHRDIIRHK
jgi:hypothetical protein